MSQMSLDVARAQAAITIRGDGDYWTTESYDELRLRLASGEQFFEIHTVVKLKAEPTTVNRDDVVKVRHLR
jgi:hypothetical protein